MMGKFTITIYNIKGVSEAGGKKSEPGDRRSEERGQMQEARKYCLKAEKAL